MTGGPRGSRRRGAGGSLVAHVKNGWLPLAVNRDLNPGATARVPVSVIPAAQQTPDETLP